MKKYLEKILDVTDVILVTLNTEGKISFINRKGSELIGVSPTEAVGKDWFENYVPTKFRSELKEYFNKIINEKVSLKEYHENSVETSKGERVILWRNTALKDSSGKIVGVLSSGIDITERRLAEEEVRLNRSFLNSIIENIPFLVFVKDAASFRYVMVNKAVEDFHGIAKEKILGKTAYDFFPKDQADKIIMTEKDAVKTRKTVEVKADQAPSKFGPRSVRSKVVPILDENGNPKNILSITEDITERNKMEEALRQSEARYKILFEESKLHENEKSALLNAARKVLTNHEFKNNSKSIFHICKNLVGAKGGHISLIDDNGNNRIIHLETGDPSNKINLQVSDLIPKSISEILYSELVYCNDLSKKTYNKYLPNNHIQLENILFAPIKIEDKIVGLISLVNKPNGFNENDAQIVNAFSDLAAISFYNSRTQELLEESEKQYRTLFESSNDAIYIHDLEGKFLEINKVACDRLGYTQWELLQMYVKDIDTPEFSSKFNSRIQKLLEGGHAIFETAQIGRDKSIIPIEISANMINYKGKPVVLSIARDLTERKQMEDALLASEDRYRGLFEDSPTPLLEEDFSEIKMYLDNMRNSGVTDFSECLKAHPEVVEHCVDLIRITDVNKSALKLFNIHNKKEHFANLRKIFTEEAVDVFRTELIAIAEGKTRFESQDIVQTLTGERKYISFQWAAAPGYEKNLRRILFSIVDITSLKRLEEEKQIMMGRIAGGVAHDLRNPLSAIRTAAYLLRSGEGEEKQKLLDLIDRNIVYADTIMQNLRDFAPIQQLKLSPAEVNTILREVIALTIIPNNVKLATFYGSIPMANLDSYKLGRVFANLILNAVQAMPHGGQLAISTDFVNGEIQVKIVDTGMGISSENMEKLFQPFFTTKNNGTGLGLANAKKVIESHGGDIKVESQEGKGSVFTVILPVSKSVIEN